MIAFPDIEPMGVLGTDGAAVLDPDLGILVGAVDLDREREVARDVAIPSLPIAAFDVQRAGGAEVDAENGHDLVGALGIRAVDLPITIVIHTVVALLSLGRRDVLGKASGLVIFADLSVLARATGTATSIVAADQTRALGSADTGLAAAGAVGTLSVGALATLETVGAAIAVLAGLDLVVAADRRGIDAAALVIGELAGFALAVLLASAASVTLLAGLQLVVAADDLRLAAALVVGLHVAAALAGLQAVAPTITVLAEVDLAIAAGLLDLDAAALVVGNHVGGALARLQAVAPTVAVLAGLDLAVAASGNTGHVLAAVVVLAVGGAVEILVDTIIAEQFLLEHTLARRVDIEALVTEGVERLVVVATGEAGAADHSAGHLALVRVDREGGAGGAQVSARVAGIRGDHDGGSRLSRFRHAPAQGGDGEEGEHRDRHVPHGDGLLPIHGNLTPSQDPEGPRGEGRASGLSTRARKTSKYQRNSR